MEKKAIHILKKRAMSPMSSFRCLMTFIGNGKAIHGFVLPFDFKLFLRYTTIALLLFSLFGVPAIHAMGSMTAKKYELIESDRDIDFDTKEKYENESKDEKIEFQISRSDCHSYVGSTLAEALTVERFVPDFKNDIPIPPPEAF